MLKQDSGRGLCLCSKPARYKPDRVLCHLKLRRLSGFYRELSFSLRQLCILSHSDPSLPAMVHICWFISSCLCYPSWHTAIGFFTQKTQKIPSCPIKS